MQHVRFAGRRTVATGRYLPSGSICLVALLISAQLQAAGDTVDSSDAGLQLKEVIVTARLRPERLERVPISATVVSGNAIATRNINTLEDLSQTIPGINLEKGSTTDRLFIRGIGSGDNPSFEQSVGTFIDGIYHGRARYSESGLFDLKRVEVLKGPQTTYFGNNAIAGALNVVTRDPGKDHSGNLRVAYTPRFNGYAAEAAVDLPMPSTFGLRIAGQANGTDGWIHDVGTGDNVPRERNSAARATLVWSPSESLTGKFKAQYIHERETGGLPLVREDCPPPSVFGAAKGFCAAAIHSNAAPFSSDSFRNTGGGQGTALDSQDYSALFTFRRNQIVLTSLTGLTSYSYDLNSDLDMTPAPLLSIQAPEHYRQFSQELRATGQHGSLNWIAGIYYQYGQLDVTNLFNYGFLTPTIARFPTFVSLVPYVPYGIYDAFHQTDNVGSAFGALTYKLSDRLSISGAIRYSVVEKNFRQNVNVGTATPGYGPFVPFPVAVAPVGATFAKGLGLATVGSLGLSRKDVQTSPSLSVQYQLSNATMIYARYDHGFKAGGFNGVDLSGTPGELPFAPEKVNAYEIGLKSRLLNDRMTLNVDVFRSNYSDLQLAGVVPSISGAYVNRVQNAGGSVSQGIELASDIRLSRRLSSNLSVTYLDAYYTRYPNATPTALQTLDLLHSQNLTGQHTPFAPSVAGSWALDYDVPIRAHYTLRIENRLFATTEVYLNFNNDPYDKQGGYARDDVTVAVVSDKQWEVDMIGQNVTDRMIRTFGAALPTSLGSYVFMTEAPANLTLQFKCKF